MSIIAFPAPSSKNFIKQLPVVTYAAFNKGVRTFCASPCWRPSPPDYAIVLAASWQWLGHNRIMMRESKMFSPGRDPNRLGDWALEVLTTNWIANSFRNLRLRKHSKSPEKWKGSSKPCSATAATPYLTLTTSAIAIYGPSSYYSA